MPQLIATDQAKPLPHSILSTAHLLLMHHPPVHTVPPAVTTPVALSLSSRQAGCCRSATYKSSCRSHRSVVFTCVPLLLSSPVVPVPLVSRGRVRPPPAAAPWPCDKRDPPFDLSHRSMLLRVRHKLVPWPSQPSL